MERNFSEIEYTQKANEANNIGKKLYIMVAEDEQGNKFANLEIADNNYYICYKANYTYGEINPDYESQKESDIRQHLDSLSLTPADVERALYYKKDMTFDDLKELIARRLPALDMKALNIEFKASKFFRGAKIGNIRLFDVIGQLLGYNSEDIDYLFLHKTLP